MEEIDYIRLHILNASLSIEKILSEILCGLLGIKESSKTDSFGRTSKALSFNQKVLLLRDIDALDTDDKTKLITFMEMRNQFIHNEDCKSLIDCFEAIKKTSFLFKSYKVDSELNKEAQCKEVYRLFINDIFDLLLKTFNVLSGKKKDKKMFYSSSLENLETTFFFLKALRKTIEKLCVMTSDEIKQVMGIQADDNTGKLIAKFIKTEFDFASIDRKYSDF